MSIKKPLAMYGGKIKEVQAGDTLDPGSVGAGMWQDRGNFDASSGAFPSTGGSGTAGAVMKGDQWVISVGGTLGTHVLNAGDSIRALVNTPGSTSTNWASLEGNLGFVPENAANKSHDLVADRHSTTKYPSVKAIMDQVDAAGTTANAWTGSRTTPTNGGHTLLTLPITGWNSNLDSVDFLVSGTTASNANEKVWAFVVDGIQTISISLEANIGVWTALITVQRKRFDKAIVTCVFTTNSGSSTSYHAEYSGMNFDGKPNNFEVFVETPGAAGDITLTQCRATPIIADEGVMVTSGLWAYFEADSYSQTDGSNIFSSWLDKSGNGRHATVSGSPTFEADELGSASPVIRMSADSSDAFTLPSMAALSAATIFIVRKVTNTGTNGGDRFGTGSGSHYPLSADGLIYDGFMSTVRKDAIASKITLLNNWHVYHAWSASNDWALYQNGRLAHATSSNTVAGSATPQMGFNGSTDYTKEDRAATYIYSGKMSAANIEKQLYYISKRWGV